MNPSASPTQADRPCHAGRNGTRAHSLRLASVGVRPLGVVASAERWTMRSIGVIANGLSDGVPASHMDLVECPRVAALSTLVATAPRRSEPVVEAAPAAPPPRTGIPRRDSGVRSYETAKRLARSGASVEEIIASSGVAGSEARLLRRLHANQDMKQASRENAA